MKKQAIKKLEAMIADAIDEATEEAELTEWWIADRVISHLATARTRRPELVPVYEWLFQPRKVIKAFKPDEIPPHLVHGVAIAWLGQRTRRIAARRGDRRIARWSK